MGSSFVQILLVVFIGIAPGLQDASTTDPRITELNALMQKGQFLKVLNKGRAILHDQPNQPQTLMLTGAACIELARTIKDTNAKHQAYAEAENLFQRFSLVHPNHNNSKVEQSLARCCLIRKDWKNAIQHADKSIQLSPSSSMAHRILGEALTGNQQHEKALQTLNKALAFSPRDTSIMHLIQGEYHTLRKYAEGLSFLLKQQDNLPQSAQLKSQFYNTLYTAYISLNDIENAQIAITKAITLNPKEAKFAPEMALNLYRLGRSEDSKLWAEKALGYSHLKTKPKAICLRILGQLLSHEGKYQEALNFLEKSYRFNPQDRSTGFAIVAALRRTGQNEKAKELIKKINANHADPRE
ncbi:MAG: tetratricopeptide repeat protein [Planctomycetia bacterium]|nr:tetratricopeptide repeat protein [Planctomycetia bacterium]